MKIIWRGESFVEIKGKKEELFDSTNEEKNIVTDPFKGAKLVSPKGKSDIILFSNSKFKKQWNENYSQASNKRIFKDSPFLISAPGEYEIGGIEIKGVFSLKGKEENQSSPSQISNIFVIKMQEMKIAFLNEFFKSALEGGKMNNIMGSSIMLVNINGKEGKLSKSAVDIINQVEPKIVIPIFGGSGISEHHFSSQKSQLLESLGKEEAIEDEAFKAKPEEMERREGTEVVSLKKV